jgi:hypothetical protein
MDERLSSFANRLIEAPKKQYLIANTSPNTFLAYDSSIPKYLINKFHSIVCQVERAFLDEVDLPWNNDIVKAAADPGCLIQQYVEAMLAGDYELEKALDGLEIDSYLIGHNLAVAASGIECLYSLDVPRGLTIGLRIRAIRALVAWDICNACYRARFDIIGKKRDPKPLST